MDKSGDGALSELTMEFFPWEDIDTPPVLEPENKAANYKKNE